MAVLEFTIYMFNSTVSFKQFYTSFCINISENPAVVYFHFSPSHYWAFKNLALLHVLFLHLTSKYYKSYKTFKFVALNNCLWNKLKFDKVFYISPHFHHFLSSPFLCADLSFHLEWFSSDWKTSFHVFYSARLLARNSLSFCLSEKRLYFVFLKGTLKDWILTW